MVKRVRGSERRQGQRLRLAIPAFVRGVDQQGKEILEFSTILNVSTEGALLSIRRHLPRSSRISLEIPSTLLPGIAVLPHPIRTLRARVVRVMHFEGWSALGLRFARPLT